MDISSINPEIETLKLTLWIASGVIAFIITMLVAVISNLISKQIETSEELTVAVNGLTVAVNVLESQNKDRYPVIEKRLNEHETKISRHAEKITAIETTLSHKIK